KDGDTPENTKKFEQGPGRLLTPELKDRREAGDEQARAARAEVGRALPRRAEPLGADLVGDHVQQRTGGGRGRGVREGALGESGDEPGPGRPPGSRPAPRPPPRPRPAPPRPSRGER